jgi:transposase-like protein
MPKKSSNRGRGKMHPNKFKALEYARTHPEVSYVTISSMFDVGYSSLKMWAQEAGMKRGAGSDKKATEVVVRWKKRQHIQRLERELAMAQQDLEEYEAALAEHGLSKKARMAS